MRGTQTTAGSDVDNRTHGLSRGGLTTKVHALVDANGLLIAFKITPARLILEPGFGCIFFGRSQQLSYGCCLTMTRWMPSSTPLHM